jgi:hypothetical protein
MYPGHASSKPVFCFLLLNTFDFIAMEIFFLEPKGRGEESSVGLFYSEYSELGLGHNKKKIVGLSSCSLCNRKFQIHSSWHRSGCCMNSCLHHSCCNRSIIIWPGNRPAWQPRLLSNSERSFGPGKSNNNIYAWETGSLNFAGLSGNLWMFLMFSQAISRQAKNVYRQKYENTLCTVHIFEKYQSRQRATVGIARRKSPY